MKMPGKFHTMLQFQTTLTTAEFASSLTANIYLLLAIYVLYDLTSKRPSIFFLVNLEQVFHEIFFGRKYLFHCFVVKVYYTFLQE